MSGPKLAAAERAALERLFVSTDPSGRRRIDSNLSTAQPPPLRIMHTLSRKGFLTYEETDVFRPFGARGYRFDITPAGRRALADAGKGE